MMKNKGELKMNLRKKNGEKIEIEAGDLLEYRNHDDNWIQFIVINTDIVGKNNYPLVRSLVIEGKFVKMEI